MADLCRAVTALKDWIDSTPLPPPALEPGDWARVRSIDIAQVPSPGPLRVEGTNYELHLYADIPERPRLVGLTMSKATGEMQFFVVHR
jgi:hypothetical protein